MCLFGMCVGDIRHTEPRYIESPRDVCWGSGIVALDDLIMFVPFPVVYTVGEWGSKRRHIKIPDAHAWDQLNVVLYVNTARVNRICW